MVTLTSTETYKAKLAALSQELVAIQRPIRILDAVKWPPEADIVLRSSGYREMPAVDDNYYKGVPLGFDPLQKKLELQEFSERVKTALGPDDELGRLLFQSAAEYTVVIEMLLARGTSLFWQRSRELYGSPKDFFFADSNSIRGMSELLYPILSALDRQIPDQSEPSLEAPEAVEELNHRLLAYFGSSASVRACVADEIWADAAAGGDTVKIRKNARFSPQDLDILEVHEGWVHLGTTQNGMLQSAAKWLAKGPPRCSSTQEGLAVIMEVLTFRANAKRARQINDRILAIDRAEDGADFLEVLEFFRTEGYPEDDCLMNAKRVFRGGVLKGGGPFTKDISYCRGYVENFNFIRAAIQAGRPEVVPFLFAGKLHVDDVPLLYRKYREGIIDPPVHLPPHFRNMGGIAVWMSFSNFLNQVDLPQIQEHYDRLFQVNL